MALALGYPTSRTDDDADSPSHRLSNDSRIAEIGVSRDTYELAMRAFISAGGRKLVRKLQAKGYSTYEISQALKARTEDEIEVAA